MKPNSITRAALLLCVMFVAWAGPGAGAFAAGNPAVWKYQVKGDYATVLARLKSGLEVKQFQITDEENLSKGLENNKQTFGPADKWNTLGFQNVTAVLFCSMKFNHEVFNLDMDWSLLCPFKVVAYNMKRHPQRITIIFYRPSYLLAKDPHRKAKEVGRKIERRIVEAIEEGVR